MRRLYIRISPSLQQYFPGGAPPDWRERAFKDATEAGTKLTMLELRANDIGPRVALLGDDFYFEAGLDRSRPDALFLTRIETAKTPNRVPQFVACDARLWPGGVPAVLDSVADLLGGEVVGTTEVSSPIVAAPNVGPSAALLAMLEDVSPELRHQFRPSQIEATAAEFLTSLRTLWARHRLDRLVDPSSRQAALLRGIINPPDLPDPERQGFLALFGFGLLNKLAASEAGGHGEIERVLRSLGEVPDSASRLSIWAALSAGLTGDELRRELFDARIGLASLADDEGRVVGAVAGAVPLLLKAAERVGDPSLSAVLEGAYSGASLLAELSEWAGQLEFSESLPETQLMSPSEVAPTDAPSAVTPAEALVVDEWVLRLRGLGPDQVREKAGYMRDLVKDCQVTLGATESIEKFPLVLTAVSDFTDAALSWLGDLPDAGALVQDRVEAEAAMSEASALLGEGALQLVSRLNDVTPRELSETVQLLKDSEGLLAVPGWMWSVGAGGTEEVPESLQAKAVALLSEKTRGAIQDFMDKLSRLGQPAAAAWLPPLPPGRPVEEHVAEWFDKAREFLLDVPPEVQQFLSRESGSTADLSVLLGNAAHLSEFKEVLGETRTQEVIDRLQGLSAELVAGELQALVAAVDFFRTNVGSLDGIGVDALLTRAAKGKIAQQAPHVHDADTRRVSVDHNWIDESGSRASLVAVPRQEGSQLAVIAVPLVLETAQPATISVRLDWQVKGTMREAWPPEWPDVEPSEPFVIYPHDWRQNPNSAGYLHSFPATFPVRLSRSESLQRLEVVATVRDAKTGDALSEPRALRWDQIETEPRLLSVEWADATNPEYIRQHPIGPQEKTATVLQRLRSGSSIAVIAPRRFGKSTLVEYLVRESSVQGLVMPSAIWCTEFWSSGGFDYQRLWERVSQSLKELLGAEIGSGRQGFLPSPEAFDHVRKVAGEKNKRAVVLLFDEAQLFFPSHGGFELSSMLKMLLERHWARAEKGMVPLLVGFVGLPSLRYRVGTDLLGLLNPIERSTMEEAELRPLIANMAKGLQTTREARARLAGAAGNLFLLRVLLERLATHLNRDGRTWAAYRDVLHVEEQLRRELQQAQPESETVAAYVRDVMNEAERVEDWRPIAAFPVAVALAQERQAGLTFEAVLEHVTIALNRWCADVADQHVRPTYDAATVADHVGTLQERGILRGDEFSSRLLGAWLLGVGGRIGQGLDDAFREALLKGAQRRIEIPQGHRVTGGGETAIVRQHDRAFRIRPVRTEQDRLHYLETVRVTQTLKDVVAERKVGSDYIFEPIDIGLSLRNSSEAVQVYRWVEGRDLSDRQGLLSEDSVVDIGLKLGRAVVLLHKNNILHRDICPRNIILAEIDAESLRPVLIDFGFARIAEGQASTTFAGQHFAPEVGTQPAYWSKAADVFGLAWTLNWLLAPSAASSEILPILGRALSRAPEERPSGEKFVAELEALGEQMTLEQRQESAWHELQRGLRPEDRHSPWVQPLLRKNRSALVALQLRFSRDRFDRYRSVADFLNQVTEDCPKRNVRFRDIEARLAGEVQMSVSFIRALRNDRVHGADAKSQETLRLIEQFKTLEVAKQRAAVVAAATQVGQACQFPSLQGLIDGLIGK